MARNCLVLGIEGIMIFGKRIRWSNTFVAFVFVLFPISAGFAQVPGENSAPAPSASGTPAQAHAPEEAKAGANETSEPPGGKRVFGVLPNYRTVDQSQVTGPLTDGQKFTIASKDSFDYPLVLLTAALSGIGQWSNQNPSFGQGMAGFSKRYVTTFADQTLGNFMTEGLLPAVLHEDPRYYRRGTGRTWSRMGYAVSRLFVTPTDSGGLRFNYSEWAGNAAATAVSNAYYPDGRTAGANAGKLAEQIGLDGFALVLKEFWPDIKHGLFERHQTANSGH
jgi:hypothetical protein